MIEQSRIDQYFKYKDVIAQAKEYMTEVEKEILEESEFMRENSKEKTFKFPGSDGNFIEVIEAEKLDFISPTALIELLNDNKDGFFKSEIKYAMSAKFSNMVKEFAAGKYIEVRLQDAVEQVIPAGLEPKQVAVLKKKLKGNFRKDYELLRDYGLEEEDAQVKAYLLQESAAYERVFVLATAYGADPKTFSKRLSELLIVDTTLKIKATASEDSE